MAPRLFNNYYELPAAAIAIALLIATIVQRDADKRRTSARAVLPIAMALAIGLIAIFATIGTARQNSMHRILVRNFYGTLRVDDVTRDGHRERQLAHGRILHGSQNLAGDERLLPTTYYGENGGAGMAVLATRNDGRPQRIGVIGLGAGTMAAYGRTGDYYRFYEINPLVDLLARSQFTFVSDTAASVDMAMGDARQSLEREQPQHFDVLVVDAFSGDSVPVHLLTREAFGVYFRHIRRGGILAVHISNRNIDLAPVANHAAAYFGRTVRLVEAKAVESKALMKSSWVLLADDASVFSAEAFGNKAKQLASTTSIRPWTDDYSSIYAILK